MPTPQSRYTDTAVLPGLALPRPAPLRGLPSNALDLKRAELAYASSLNLPYLRVFQELNSPSQGGLTFKSEGLIGCQISKPGAPGKVHPWSVNV